MLVLISFLTAAAFAPGQTVKTGTIFDIGKDRPQRAVVTVAESVPEFDAGAPEMVLAMSGEGGGGGVLADLRTLKEVDALRACVPHNPMLGDAGGAERLCTVHLFAKAAKPGGQPKADKRIAVYRDKAGEFIAVELGAARPERAQLKRDTFAALYFDWPNYRGSFEDSGLKDPIAAVFELPKPYLAGRFALDKKTLGDRFLAGGTTSLDGANRVLDDEKFEARLPRGYSARRPAGLLIWISPMSSGSPPAVLWPALDAMNLVCIGAADAGNQRSATDRYQLVFDALATASRRYHIDPRRIYLTGMSGGGKVSSILQGCFPDVFAGAVPIVGLSCYETIPSGTGFFYRADYQKPRAPIFNLCKTRRMAPMTGRKDFNEVPIQQAAAIMLRDGLPVKLFEDPKMGHEMPRADQFSEAIMWVDEPYRKVREAEEAAAKKAMDACRARFMEKKPDEAWRKVLFKVMEAGAWTEGAWEAATAIELPEAHR